MDTAYLTDPVDRVVFSSTPTLMAPRNGTLPPVPIGQHRFVAAHNGLFVQARTKALAVTLRIAETPRLPYGRLEESVELAGGPIPAWCGARIVERALSASPDEWAGVVVWTGTEYEFVDVPIKSVSGGHVTYHTDVYDDEAVALDVHSHGAHGAFFSATDDSSDTGIYLAAVVGRCQARTTIEVATRIVVRGIFYQVPWRPWATEPSVVA